MKSSVSMMNERKRAMNVLVVGLDGFERWAAKPHFKVVGVVDLYGERERPDRLAAVDACSRYPVFTDIREALSAVATPDFASVAVPGDSKNTIVAEAELAVHGIDVVIQKARLGSMRDVVQLAEAASCGSARIIVGEHYRYLPHIRTLKKIIREGRIGKTEYILWNCFLPCEAFPWMKAYRHLTLEDLSYHHFGVLHDVLGFHPTRLYARSFEPSYSQASTKTTASVIAETLEGYRLHYQAVWNSRIDRADYLGEILVEGTKGSVLVSNEKVFLFSPSGVKREVTCLPASYTGAEGVLDHWYDSVHAEGAMDDLDGLPFTFQQFEPVLGAIYGAVESAEKNSVVEWPNRDQLS